MHAERQAAVEAILRAGHIPAGMELFAAGDEAQIETIRRWIDDSDIFMLISGGRYGSIEPKSEKSYIELEYDYAVKIKKPHFTLVIHDEFLDAKVAEHGRGVLEQDNGPKFKAFRDRLTKKTCRFFKDENELKLAIFESVANIERTHQLAGWIHGSDVVDPKATLEAMEVLRYENGELKRKLEEAEAGSSDSGKKLIRDLLSEHAKELLHAGANDGGKLIIGRVSGGYYIQTDSAIFLPPEERPHREDAQWKAAVNELLGHGLLDSTGGEIHELTELGCRVNGALQQLGWQPSLRDTDADENDPG